MSDFKKQIENVTKNIIEVNKELASYEMLVCNSEAAGIESLQKIYEKSLKLHGLIQWLLQMRAVLIEREKSNTKIITM